jgi:transposase
MNMGAVSPTAVGSGWQMDMRELKGLEIAARSRIAFKEGVWLVPSQSGNGTYRVALSPEGDSCPCEDFSLTGKPCKHVFAARIVRERDHGGAVVPLDTTIIPKRPTYPQNWPAYNLAQSTEKHRLQVLLADLCAGVAEPPYAGTGRKPIPVADRLFACAFKVYSTLSTRRFACDLKDAHERGYLSRTLHHNKVNCFLCDPDLTPLLYQLVQRSALPLRTIETTFAPDSTGFSTSKFVRWYDEKYGVERSGHDWVKVHVMTGTKTGVITAVRIEGRDAGDSPQFGPLLKTTAENFKIEEVSADKGYLAVENVEAVAACGGQAFIAPKVNTTGGVGGLFEKMFHYYQFRREEFLAHYHQRSNVESVFSAVKRKFGDSVRSRNDVAMVNECLCKLLCNNLCCVILSQIELGIEAEFWKAGGEGSRDVLPLVRPGS